MATLSISAYTALSANVDFTALTVGGKNDDDWRVFDSLTTTQQKSGGTGAISDFSYAGGTGTDAFNGGATFGRVISWTDGTPTASGSNSAGIRQNTNTTTDNRGFSFTVSGVGTGEQTLRVIVGRYSNAASADAFKITASISDGSTGNQTSTLIGKTSDEDGYYDITMSAASAGQTVTVTWQSNTLAVNTFRACNLRGAWLSTATASGISGTVAVTTGDDTSSATGMTTVLATSAITSSNDTSAASGTTTVLAIASPTTGDDTSAASGTTTVLGASSSTTGNDVSTASGSVGSAISGSATITTADDTSTATGTTNIIGSVNVITGNDTSSASGTTTVTATSSVTTGDDTSQASGFSGAITANADITTGNDNCVAYGSTPDLQQNTGGYASWNHAHILKHKRRELQDADLPKAVKKAIQKVAKLNLPDIEAEAELRLRTQQIQWNNEYLGYMQGLQEAMQEAIAYEHEQLNSRLRTAAFNVAYQAKISSEMEDRQRRIQIIMYLI